MSRLNIYWPELSTENTKEHSFDVVMTPNLADKICKGWQYLQKFSSQMRLLNDQALDDRCEMSKAILNGTIRLLELRLILEVLCLLCAPAQLTFVHNSHRLDDC